MPQRFTSWEAIYKTLLAAFPAESYHLGAEMAGFNQTGDPGPVSVRLADGRTAEADLLVCADGWCSATRRHRRSHGTRPAAPKLGVVRPCAGRF
jgi:2-polyprenyl-6-methoxyphenol hydroxylase-like FAD-dependent oxidoreductase